MHSLMSVVNSNMRTKMKTDKSKKTQRNKAKCNTHATFIAEIAKNWTFFLLKKQTPSILFSIFQFPVMHYVCLPPPPVLHKLLLWNTLGNMHFSTIVYAKFGGQTECIMGNWKIENIGIQILQERLVNLIVFCLFLTIASFSVSCISNFTLTRIWADCIYAICIDVTVMSICITLVPVCNSK